MWRLGVAAGRDGASDIMKPASLEAAIVDCGDEVRADTSTSRYIGRCAEFEEMQLKRNWQILVLLRLPVDMWFCQGRGATGVEKRDACSRTRRVEGLVCDTNFLIDCRHKGSWTR